MTSPNASLQVSSRRKFTDNKPNLGQRRSGGLKLQQSTNSSHVVILVANSY